MQTCRWAALIPLLAELAGVLSGCGLIEAAQPPGEPPAGNYKALIRDYIENTFFDPYSLRDVAISFPVPGVLNFASGWIVCVEANARNRMGGYIGLEKTTFLIKNEQIKAMVEGASICENAAFAPWPIMENRGAGGKGS
jgi:hypothetical protein